MAHIPIQTHSLVEALELELLEPGASLAPEMDLIGTKREHIGAKLGVDADLADITTTQGRISTKVGESKWLQIHIRCI